MTFILQIVDTNNSQSMTQLKYKRLNNGHKKSRDKLSFFYNL